MKTTSNNPTKFYTLIVVVTLFFCTAAKADWVTLNNEANKAAQTELISSTVERSVVKCIIPGFNKNDADNNMISLALEGTTPMMQKGAPELLKVSTSLIVSDQDAMRVNVLESNYVEFPDIDIIPSSGDVSRYDNSSSVNFGAVYNNNAFFPENIVTLSDPYILRDFRGQVVQFFPFQYNPVTKVLRVYTDLTVEVVSTGTTGNNIKTYSPANAAVSHEYNNVYNSLFLNFESVAQSQRYVPVEEEGNMLVVCHEDFAEAMVPFVNWKNEKGIPTEMVIAGQIGDAYDIKDFVSNYYFTHGLTYLLLVGDAGFVPTYYTENGASDVSYGYIDGNDHYPEVFVGRFSAATADQVTVQVEKTIAYEKNPVSTNNWLEKTVGIASDLGPGDNGEYDYEHVRFMQHKLTSYTYTHAVELFDGSNGNADADGNPTASMVADALSQGAGCVLYTGRGMTNGWESSYFTTENVDDLTNYNMTPFVISTSCYTGDFANETCLAETLLRASKNGHATGAVAALMSSTKQSWYPPMYGQDAMIDIMVESNEQNVKRTIGGITMNGCMAMNDKYGFGGYKVTDNWNLFGDPSLEIRTAAPSVIVANHHNTVSEATSVFTVKANVKNGVACLSQNSEIVGVAKLMNGTADINITNLVSDIPLSLVVTSYNCIPYISAVSFDNNPTKATSPTPSNHRYLVSPYVTLEWVEGNGAASEYYKVYVGTDNPPTNMLNGVISMKNTIHPVIPFDYDQTYFWRVDTYNEYGFIEGDVWEFNVISHPDETFETEDLRGGGAMNGSNGWVIDHEEYFNGEHSARSGYTPNNSSTSLSYSIIADYKDFVEFYVKVSSEAGKDKLLFLVDGEVRDSWSGELDWTEVSFDITPGNHLIEWRYEKDEANESGSDCAWLDDIYFPTRDEISANAGEDFMNCPNDNIYLHGYCTSFTNVDWFTMGDGYFVDATEMSPTYVPGVEDLKNGSVEFMLIANNDLAKVVTMDRIEVTFNEIPEINISDYYEITRKESIEIDAYQYDIMEYTWSDGSKRSTFTFDAYGTEPGLYMVSLEAISSTGCVIEKRITINVLDASLSGREEVELSMNTYPNPSNGLLTLEISSTVDSELTNAVYNQTGMKVYEETKNIEMGYYNEKIDLTHLPKGMYLITSSCADKDVCQKVIIQ